MTHEMKFQNHIYFACPIDLTTDDVDIIDNENEMAKKEVQL